ncbi:uncharacterized protein LOC112088893 [Eutrema salsugineum]|uniref:uncharacterized protein LOC112088893 n=1 Tax=Eutrema salsugineum TaxID=72664 RepID=UPI000CED5673|nr:uncharacterized protein LOC112088893 [Eutrema salsugineum]
MEQGEELSWMTKTRHEFLQGNNKTITIMTHKDYWVLCADTLCFSLEIQFH